MIVQDGIGSEDAVVPFKEKMFFIVHNFSLVGEVTGAWGNSEKSKVMSPQACVHPTVQGCKRPKCAVVDWDMGWDTVYGRK